MMVVKEVVNIFLVDDIATEIKGNENSDEMVVEDVIPHADVEERPTRMTIFVHSRNPPTASLERSQSTARQYPQHCFNPSSHSGHCLITLS